jgi:16S rRNA (guanine966-N2)-methyltransferase
MSKRTRRAAPPTHSAAEPDAVEGRVRIIGGSLRGRNWSYRGDPRTRPMKDRVREALFNLVGPRSKGSHAIDLFAGTGAIGFEALSRGAARATLFERHFPTAKLLQETARELGVAERVEVIAANTLLWFRQPHEIERPTWRGDRWTVFSSPPYALLRDEAAAYDALIHTLWNAAPAGGTFALESDASYDPIRLPGDPQGWDERRYPPAVLWIARRD